MEINGIPQSGVRKIHCSYIDSKNLVVLSILYNSKNIKKVAIPILEDGSYAPATVGLGDVPSYEYFDGWVSEELESLKKKHGERNVIDFTLNESTQGTFKSMMDHIKGLIKMKHGDIL